MNLSSRKCVSCESGSQPFDEQKTAEYLKLLNPGWIVSENKTISKEFRFKNYAHTMKFVNQVAQLAEADDHHPVMHVHYGKAIIDLWTHSIGGLSENDFILAAKIDQLQE